jgi:hypothetical protein
MAQPFDSIVKEIKDSIIALNLDRKDLFKDLKNAKLIDTNDKPSTTLNSSPLSSEFQDVIAALIPQNNDYTENTSAILNILNPLNSLATLETLETATNIIQIYFQVTQPLEQILSDLFDNLPSTLSSSNTKTIQTHIQKIKTDREKLREAQTNAVQEFGDVLDELDLEMLVQNSSTILKDLKNPNNSTNLLTLSTEIERLINHLKKAGKLFKDFSENNGNLTGREPNQIKTLIRNWEESVSQIETIETTNPNVQSDLSKPDNSRSAIAQSIKIHDLLEANYDYLTALVRSIDLVSAGSL